jgi:quercetin dioxygenase-like cupin family protein
MSKVWVLERKSMRQAIRKTLLVFFAVALAATCQSTYSTATAQSSSSSAASTQITITPTNSQQVITGAPDRFTGSVRVQSLFDAKEPARSTGGQVTFQPGARSAWHTHPLGQILIVTDGVGWVQQWGGPVQVIRKGDVVWIPAGVKHWHGATPTTTMTHLALQEQLDGKVVDWLEKVTDDQYRLTK